MGTYDLIASAIKTKQQVIATYDGHEREMCPHAIGEKHGRAQALFFQFGGTSASGGRITPANGNWRCIPVAGLSDVRVRSGEWHTGTSHSQQQTCIDVVHVEVDY